MLYLLILSLFIPYAAIVLLFAFSQRSLIYASLRAPPLPIAGFGLAPEAARDIAVSASDGVTLHGWLLYANTKDDANPDARHIDRLVIYFPGNAGHRGYRIPDLIELTHWGFDVLIFDYRGYAENSGAPNQPAMQADARTIWKFAVNELRVDPARIMLFGESMGGAVAIHLAADLCEQGTSPAALITKATFASLAETAQWHYPWLPCKWLLLDKWRSTECISRVTCPILMFHGTQDTIVPLEQGRKLFAAAAQQSANGIPSQFIELPTHGHNDIPLTLLRDQFEALTSRAFGHSAPAH